MNKTANLNIRMDRDVMERAEQIFDDLGLTMTAAINLFLKTTIRENGIPFSHEGDIPNETTMAAIREGKQILSDPTAKGYHNMKDLREALEL